MTHLRSVKRMSRLPVFLRFRLGNQGVVGCNVLFPPVAIRGTHVTELI